MSCIGSGQADETEEPMLLFRPWGHFASRYFSGRASSCKPKCHEIGRCGYETFVPCIVTRDVRQPQSCTALLPTTCDEELGTCMVSETKTHALQSSMKNVLQSGRVTQVNGINHTHVHMEKMP